VPGPAGPQGAPGAAATAGGATTQVQFNDAGAFAGNAAFAFDKVTGQLTLDWISGGYSTGGLKLKSTGVTGGAVVLQPTNTSGLYVTDANGNPAPLLLGAWQNPYGGSFTATTGAYTISGTNSLVLPGDGSAAATRLNFGTPGTGITGSSAQMIFAVSGVYKFIIDAAKVVMSVPIWGIAGSTFTATYNFGTQNTGLYGSATAVSGVVTGVNKFTVDANAFTISTPLLASTGTTVERINPWKQLTQAAYDAIVTKDPNILYVVVG